MPHVFFFICVNEFFKAQTKPMRWSSEHQHPPSVKRLMPARTKSPNRIKKISTTGTNKSLSMLPPVVFLVVVQALTSHGQKRVVVLPSLVDAVTPVDHR